MEWFDRIYISFTYLNFIFHWLHLSPVQKIWATFFTHLWDLISLIRFFPRIRIWFLNRCWLVLFYFDLVPELHYHLEQYLQQLNFYQINHSLHLQTCQDECLFWSICFRFFFLHFWTEPRMINYFPTLLDISQFSKMMKK